MVKLNCKRTILMGFLGCYFIRSFACFSPSPVYFSIPAHLSVYRLISFLPSSHAIGFKSACREIFHLHLHCTTKTMWTLLHFIFRDIFFLFLFQLLYDYFISLSFYVFKNFTCLCCIQMFISPLVHKKRCLSKDDFYFTFYIYECRLLKVYIYCHWTFLSLQRLIVKK